MTESAVPALAKLMLLRYAREVLDEPPGSTARAERYEMIWDTIAAIDEGADPVLQLAQLNTRM